METTESDIIVGPFHPSDAPGIVDLFQAVYGNHYPIRLFYDPAAIIAANEDGRYCSIVARNRDGDVVGVNHLYPSAPYRGLYESGVVLVLKEYRSHGANRQMLGSLYEHFLPKMPHVEEVFGEAVCNHLYMQKTANHYRFVEMAIQIALMPAEAYTQEQTSRGRVATVASFRCYRPKRHRIFLPAAYDATMRWIYARLDDERDMDRSMSGIPKGSTCRGETTFFDFTGVARVAMHEIGEDFPRYFRELNDQMRLRNTAVLQVWLDLTMPWVGEAIEILRDHGCFFGGPLPRWFDGDGILMQKLFCPPGFEDIVLDSDFAKELLDIIKEDWKRISS